VQHPPDQSSSAASGAAERIARAGRRQVHANWWVRPVSAVRSSVARAASLTLRHRRAPALRARAHLLAVGMAADRGVDLSAAARRPRTSTKHSQTAPRTAPRAAVRVVVRHHHPEVSLSSGAMPGPLTPDPREIPTVVKRVHRRSAGVTGRRMNDETRQACRSRSRQVLEQGDA
jgi:hypothetical protein